MEGLKKKKKVPERDIMASKSMTDSKNPSSAEKDSYHIYSAITTNTNAASISTGD